MTKMGIKEFRGRLSEVAQGTEVVDVTHHGRVVGTFKPRRKDPETIRRAAASIQRWQDEMKAKGIDLEAELRAMGIGPDGEPLDQIEGANGSGAGC